MRLRFEIAAAWVMGFGLPLAETIRRRTNFSTITGYVDDFILGALLVIAARAATKERPSGPVLLVLAWGATCGAMYGSFFVQLANESGTDEASGFPNWFVVAVKGLYAFQLSRHGVDPDARSYAYYLEATVLARDFRWEDWARAMGRNLTLFFTTPASNADRPRL